MEAKPKEIKPTETVVLAPLKPTLSKLEKYRKLKPSREILESILADVLEDLGFKVLRDAKLESRRGPAIEVDVWAYKEVFGTRFNVYGSCKNWEKPVDRSVIDEEFGRVMNLKDQSHLKILVVKELTQPAKQVAESDGFITIELGSKAEADNAGDIYEIIHSTLNRVFLGIAPPKLVELAAKLSQISQDVARISRELEKLALT